MNGRLDNSLEIFEDSITSMVFGHGRGFNNELVLREVRGPDNREQSLDEPNDEYFVGPSLGFDFRMGCRAHINKFGSYKGSLSPPHAIFFFKKKLPLKRKIRF
jgi:hypothetical protein